MTTFKVYNKRYDGVFQSDTKIKLVKLEEDIVPKFEEEKIVEAWKKSKNFRKGWYDRVTAEYQLKQMEEDK